MSTLQRELGKVRRVVFGLEDHGILTLWVHLDFGGSDQGFGGIGLSEYDKVAERQRGTAAGTDLVLRVLVLFGVASLDKIAGRFCYALRSSSRGDIEGLQLTEPEGGKRFLLADWRAVWFPGGAQ